MLLNPGDNILVSHRRLFEREHSRYFVGRVDGYEAGIVRAVGFTYLLDPMSGKVIGKDEPRIKLLSIASGTLIVYLLPPEAGPDKAWVMSEVGRLVLTNGEGYTMNLTEDAHAGRV
jgi:hypothetical protein